MVPVATPLLPTGSRRLLSTDYSAMVEPPDASHTNTTIARTLWDHERCPFALGNLHVYHT
ncbi:hypothetical protein D3C86_248500 [compost metagenome]